MATAIRGRLVRQTTKQPLQGIIIEAINVTTGVAASSTTTTDTEGFYSLTGLTDATYFANPLVAGDDWIIQPDTNVLFGGAIYIPDDATTPRVQITNADFGGIVGLDTGDTYDDSDGSGTYQFLLSQNDGKAYFGGGDVVLDDSGIVIDGNATLSIEGSATAAGLVIPVQETISRTSGGGDTIGMYIELTRSGTAEGGTTGLYSLLLKTDSNDDASSNTIAVRGEYRPVLAGGTVSLAIGVSGGINLVAGGGGLTITEARAVTGSVFGSSGTITTSIGGYFSADTGTNQRGVVIAAPSSGANHYAIYSSATAQSVHAGNVRIGSTTAPTAALHVTGDGLFDPSTAGEATLALNNGSSNSAAATTISMSVPATSTGDLKWNATIASTKAWSWGIDNSDSDAWVLSENASLGSSNRIRTVGSLVELLTTAKATANGWYIKGGSASYGSDTAGVLLDMAFDTADTDLAINAIHSATTGAGNAVFTLSTHPSGTGDPQVHFRVSGTQSWRIGVDNSASDALVISRGSGLGTNDVLSISTGDIITLANGVNIAVNTSTGTKIGTATTQKLGFFNATPVVRQTAPAAAPAGGTGVAAGGWSSATNRDTAINCINGIRTALINLGLIG